MGDPSRRINGAKRYPPVVGVEASREDWKKLAKK